QATIECRDVEIKYVPVIDEKLKFIPATDSERFLKDFERTIEITKPRLIVIATPDNPTSQVWPSDVVEKMCKISLKHKTWFVMDLSYRSIYFAERPDYYKLSFRDYENLITIHSFSKDFSLLGLRAAYVIAREDVIAQLEHIEGARNLSPVTLVQLALLKFFEQSTTQELEEYFQGNRQKYQKASEVMVGALRKELTMPTLLVPNSGFYTILKIASYGIESDVDFASKLSEQERTAVVPGSAFGETLRGSLRLSYAPLVENPGMIAEGVRRLAKMLKNQG
ncbi:MAG: pyridoxal phosphate-dependent aminotransferase, partial [Candidatus Burarchaeum sp.]